MSNKNVTDDRVAVDKGSINDRAARVFEFLVELQRLKTRVVRDLGSYRSVLWYAELPQSPSVTSPHRDPEAQSWLSVDRVERLRPPAPPADVAPWLTDEQLMASERDVPVLSPRILRPLEVLDDDGDVQTITEELLLDDHPEVERDLAAWLPDWTEWALEDRRRRAVAEKYQQLYEMHQDARDLAETYEVVLCFGLLRSTSGGAPVRRHVLAARATVELDLSTGRLSVEPDPEDAAVRLEQDMLDPADSVPEEVRQSVVELLGQLDGPWTTEDSDVMGVLRTWTNGLSADARFEPGLSQHVGRSEEWSVTYAPAIVLRERTKRSFIAAGQQIVDSLRAGAAVPSGVRKFIEIGGGQPSEEARASWSAAFADGETYFSKPANEEQRQILERLAHSSTLVVQGPPGTGKTHTIANLITDLLAHGQRVLITSTTARALKVLKEQLPDEVADLCVSVTDDAVRGQADVERSVKRILQERQEWDEPRAEAAAARTRRKLADARDRAARASQELRALREAETYRHAPDVGDYQGTLAEIATVLAGEEAERGWLGRVDRNGPAPFSNSDAREFLRLLRLVTPALKSKSGVTIGVTTLLAPSDFEDLCRRQEDQRRRSHELEAARGTAAYASLVHVDGEHRTRIRHDLLEIDRLTQSLLRTPGSWVPTAVSEVLAGKDKTWIAQLEESRSALTTARHHAPHMSGRSITGLDSIDLETAYTQADDLARFLTSGGKLKGLFGPTRAAKDASDLLDRVRVDGRRCEGNETLEPVWHLTRIERALRPQEQLFDIPANGASLPQRLGRLEDEIEVLTDVVALAMTVEDLRGTLRSLQLADIDPRVPAEVTGLKLALDAVDVEALEREIALRIRPLEEQLVSVVQQPGAAPVNQRMLSAVRSWNADAYRQARQEREEANAANRTVEDLASARAPLAKALPELVRAVERDPSNEVWTRQIPLLVQAWSWSVWNARVARATDPTAEERAWRRLEEADRDRSSALRQLAGNRGWAHCMRRLTDFEAAHLSMYSISTRKIGKGTGKYASRHRADARKALRSSQTAVPAWIMPMHQVFDTVPVDAANIFDVVIIDEASQSGLEGLLLSWLAPRIVVVGDDKQVSPSNVGLDHEQVFSLQDRYLSDLPTKSLFGPLSSLFDQADGMAGQRLMLREHFRCMPEIIAFSNELSYDNKLIALRQYGAERLPPLRSTYVRGAMVNGSGSTALNEAEADALVEQIAKCVADPAYDDKTFGVITLLGSSQDKLLTDKLLNALGVEEVEVRRLRVSNPEGFQGDERDVIFMSMVSSLQSLSGPARIGALSKESDQQRLNVAASRARDQLWLFHSVQPTELSMKDLRRTLLEHMLRSLPDQAVQDLGEVHPNVRNDAFDSLFEQRVYLAIRSRGFRVRPQAPAGRYKIDLVVEGGRKRLAVECDGDAFHGAEEADDDISRQRELERVGWIFWRVRGSAFARDPQAALEPLWALLDELDIHPMQDELGGDVLHDVVMAKAVAVEEVPVSAPPVELQPVEPPHASVERPASAQPALRQLPSPRPVPAAVEPAAAGEEQPRFRNGRVLVSSTARRRVQDEIAGIVGWLAAPPGVLAVDDRSRKRQEANRRDQIERMEERLEQLQRVVEQSEVDAQAGGRWVTPGCRLALRFGVGSVSQECVISILENESFMHISPDAPLGQALEGQELGATVAYEVPRGRATATITRIID